VSLRFHLDEDCQATALIQALRQRGFDAITTNEAGLAGVSDEGQLRVAALAGRVLVTNNIRDFVPLHSRWLLEAVESHAGIVLFTQRQFSIGETVRRLALMNRRLSPEDMRNRLEWLHAWSA